ncbi:MAG: metallophosphoesterase [Methylococcales bacterium]|nr:metallophosphoesterase [Methylococcales bacterium]MDD5755295.1 metallophosphoesterase [Methylococcales bacterium]
MLFAVGDIHGNSNELTALHDVIRREIDSNENFQHSVIHLGDYIDRGYESKKVLEILAKGIGREKVEQIFLLGNHEKYLIDLISPEVEHEIYAKLNRRFNTWFGNGGLETMASFGIDSPRTILESGFVEKLRRKTINVLGSDLVTFLSKLKIIHKVDDYVFVHAGINPKFGLDEQSIEDLLSIRTPFIHCDNWEHDFCVVHGHTVSVPSVHEHRISVDAGCYRGRILCAVQFKDNQLRFLAVTEDEQNFVNNYPWSTKSDEFVWQYYE